MEQDRIAPGIAADDLGAIADGLSDGIIVFDAELRVRSLNRAYRRIFELQPDEILPGDHLSKVLKVLAGRGMLGEPAQAGDAELAARVAAWRLPANRREERRLRNGRLIEIRRYDTADGGMVSVHVERTGQEEREREIERQRSLMQSIFANISDGLALVDESGRFVAFNDTFLDLHRVPRDAVRWGVHFLDLAEHFGDLAGLDPARRQVEIDRRYRFVTDPTRTRVMLNLFVGRTLEVVKTVLPDRTAVLCARDVTAELRRRREVDEARRRAEESNRQKASFVANLSHEMRNALNGVLGLSNILVGSELAPDQRRQVELIANSGAMLLRLIDDALDLSRIEAETSDLQLQSFALGEAVDECWRIVEPTARAKGLEMRRGFDPAGLPVVTGDAMRLKQVLLNLLTNAVKFTDAGHVELGVAAVIAGSEVDVVIHVADSGIGIAPEQREAVFRAFYQVRGGDRRAGGVGLGLSISQKLMRAMGGRIEVTGEAPQGTRFTVSLTLPLAAASEDIRPA